MSLADYNAQEKHWLSPTLVLTYLDQIYVERGSTFIKSRNQLFEAKTVALTLLGIHKLTGRHFFMQIPRDINSSPDIVTMNLREYEDRPIQMEIQFVEVVEYGEESSEDLGSFILNKKMDPKISGKAYDDKTIIVCHITKKELLVDHTALYEQIRSVNPQPELYILGAIPHTASGNYRLKRIWHQTDPSIVFNLYDEAKTYPKPDSLKLSIGTNKKINFTQANQPLPDKYEVFELK